MAEKVTFDGPNKLIIVNNGETDLDAQRDVYSAWKRWLIEQDTYGSTSQYVQALRTVGGDTITAEQDVSPYFFLMNGWVLRPHEANHLLTVDGNLFVDGGGNPFTPTVSAYNVTINLLTSSKSITTTVSVSAGSGLSQAESDQLFSLPAEEVISQEVWSEQVSAYTGMGSAGQVQQQLLYGNKITIDSDDGIAGTNFPIGTHRFPVSNLDDALTIARTYSIDMLELHTDLTVEANHNISNLVIETIGIMGTTVTLSPGCSAANSAFRYVNLEGTLTNGDIILVESCTVLGLDNFTGVMNVVAFGQGAEISLGSWAEIIQGTAGGSAGNEPEITIGTAGLNMSHYTGNIKLKGKTGTDKTVINSSSSNIIIDSTCVSGSIALLGIGELEADNSGPNCQVDIDAFISKANIAVAVWDEPLVDHTNAETTGDALLQQSYNGEVYIDRINGTPGTVYPAGISQEPVDSMADALTVASLYELSTIHVIGAIIISGGEDLSGFSFHSDRSLGNSVNLINYTTDYTYFNDLTVSGTTNGSTRFTYCVLGQIDNLTGGIKNSLITDSVNFIANGNNYMTDCDTFITGQTYANINIADSDYNMIRGRGQYQLSGKTSTGVTPLDLNGTVRVDSTCVSGTIVIAGLTRIIDESGPNCTVLEAALTNASIADSVWSEPLTGSRASLSAEEILLKIQKLAALIPAGV